MKTELDIEAGKSPEQIEREIDAQRASIGNIVDALESKFTPGQMFDQTLALMQNNGTTFLSNLGTSVRNNPVPAVLTSVGLLWLMMSQNRPPTPRPGYRAGPDHNRVAEWADDVGEGIDTARERLHQSADTVNEGYQAIKNKAANLNDALGTASENISHTVHDVGDRLARSSQMMSTQFSQLLKEQPLMVAAAGIALGAMLGAALPSTATEQRYMGKTSARLAEKVKHQAQEGYEAVRDTVTRTTDHSSDETKPDGEPRTTSSTDADLSQGLGTS
jgi:ElaB/YqjD/DUF883 family membrane-anchored ribosome-binding protein